MPDNVLQDIFRKEATICWLLPADFLVVGNL